MRKTSTARGILTLVCSQTGGEISGGVVYTHADLERAKPAKMLLECPHCGKPHLFMFADARLKPIASAGDGSADRSKQADWR